jgi:hypothetical protein
LKTVKVTEKTHALLAEFAKQHDLRTFDDAVMQALKWSIAFAAKDAMQQREFFNRLSRLEFVQDRQTPMVNKMWRKLLAVERLLPELPEEVRKLEAEIANAIRLEKEMLEKLEKRKIELQGEIDENKQKKENEN